MEKDKKKKVRRMEGRNKQTKTERKKKGKKENRK